MHEIISEQYALLNDSILPALAREGIVFIRRGTWSPEQQAWIQAYFQDHVMPVLTPIGLDPAHPFPRVLNKSLNFAVELEGLDAFGRDSGAAIVQAPRALPRVIELPREITGVEHGFVFLSSVLHACRRSVQRHERARLLSPQVTRNSDLFVDEEEVKDLRASLKGELQQRHFGDGVRLEVADNCSVSMSDFLLHQFNLSPSDLYRTPGIVNLVRLMQIPDRWTDPTSSSRRSSPASPRFSSSAAISSRPFANRDILLHHPFQSFEPVINLLKAGAEDPQVPGDQDDGLSHRDRLGADAATHARSAKGQGSHRGARTHGALRRRGQYRLGGKARRCRRNVVYGVFGYKTHAKLLMLVRREDDRLRRYVHREPATTIRHDAVLHRFRLAHRKRRNGCGRRRDLQTTHRPRHRQCAQASLAGPVHAAGECRRGDPGRGSDRCRRRPAKIMAKMNALLEPETILALYEASKAGVQG